MLLTDLFVIGLAAVAGGWVCRRLGIPELLGYLAAGMLLGPHAGATSFVRDVDAVGSLATFAVVFRMYTLGLEFDARRISGRWRPAMFAGVLELGACALLGVLAAPFVGATRFEGAVLGAALGTTSTNILTRALVERNEHERDDARAAGAATLAEDLVAMSLVALLAVFHGASTAQEILTNAIWLVVFASLALTAGALLVPAWLDRLSRAGSDELLTLAVVGVLFGFAALSESLGAGRPIGAFLAGIAVGAARHAPGVATRVVPLRDLLTATFYVSAGLLLEPTAILAAAPVALALVAVFVPLKVLATAVGLRLGGTPPLTAARAGAILGQTGTLGIVVAAQPFLDTAAFSHLFAIAFVAWAVTVALTPARLRFLPDVAERVAAALGARHAPPAPPGHHDGSRTVVSLALATGCAVGVAAVATMGARWMPAMAAVVLGAAAAALVVPFSLAAGRIAARGARRRVHAALLAPQRLGHAAFELERPGAMGGRAAATVFVVAAAALLAAALARPDERLPLAVGAAAVAVALLLRRSFARRLVDEAERVVSARPQWADTSRRDVRGRALPGTHLETIPVEAGTRAAWASLRELDLSGAALVAVLREGVTQPLGPTLRLRPGDEVVLGGGPMQLHAARRALLAAEGSA